MAALDPELRINCFGHLGDGNLHYNVFPPRGQDRGRYDSLRETVKRTVHDLVHELGGSVGAEHGVGRLKAGDLVRYGDPGALAASRAIKAALDPLGILNPARCWVSPETTAPLLSWGGRERRGVLSRLEGLILQAAVRLDSPFVGAKWLLKG